VDEHCDFDANAEEYRVWGVSGVLYGSEPDDAAG